jgi:WD40 repeat protein
MPQVEKLLIFLASPSDVPTERRYVEEVVADLNRTVAPDKGVMLQVVRWENDAFPGYGQDAQALINAQIAEMVKYALFVGIMWNRLGTPTPRATSGTVEEFERAVEALKQKGQPEIWFYFRDSASRFSTEEQLEQRKKVLAFKAQVQASGMPWTYKSPSDFRNKFRNQMTLWLSTRIQPNIALGKQQPHASPSSANIDKALSVDGDTLETVDHDRYLDLAVFPEDEAVPEGALQLLWGLDVSKTRQCVDRLVTRSLATVRQRADDVMLLNLNYLQNAYVRKRREQELPQLHERLLAAYAAKCWERGPSGDLRLGASDRRTGRLFPQNMVSYGCTAPWHLGPNDGYFFQRLPWHMAQAGRLAELRNLLLDFSWLLAKLRAAKVQALVADCDLLPDDQEIAFVQNALQLSTPALVRDPDQLPGHLAGRLRGFTEAGVNALVECAAQAQLDHPWLCPQTTASLEPPGPRITTLIGHTDAVRSVAALPDGIHILSGSDDTCVVLWNTKTGESFFLRGHTAGVTAVAVVQPRERALSGSKDKTLVLWDLKTRSEIRRFEDHSEAVTSVAVVPDGRLAVSGSDDKTLILWDLGTGVPLRRLEGHAEAVTCVTVLPNGDRALSGSKDNSLILWNLRTGKIIRRLEGHGHWVNVVSLMPDGTRALSGSYDHRLILWDLETGRSLRVFQQANPVVAVAVLPDGSRALVGYDYDVTIALWDLQSGRALVPFKSHTHHVTAIALLPDGTHAVSASQDTTVILWDIRRVHRRPPWHDSAVGAVAALPDGRHVLSGGVAGSPFDGILRLWDVETGKASDRTGGQGVATLAVSPDGTRALCGEALGALEVLNPKSPWPLARLRPAGELLNVYAETAAFLAGSTRALAGYTDGTLVLWNLETFQEIRRFRENACCISRVAVLPDSPRALIGYVDGTLMLYDLERGQTIRDFEVHRMIADILRVRYGVEKVGAISGLAALPDGRRALSGSLIGHIVLLDLETGQSLHQFDLKEGLSAVALVAESHRAVLASGRSVLLYDFERGEIVASFIGDTRMRCVDTLREDLFVAGSADGAVHILRLLT